MAGHDPLKKLNDIPKREQSKSYLSVLRTLQDQLCFVLDNLNETTIRDLHLTQTTEVPPSPGVYCSSALNNVSMKANALVNRLSLTYMHSLF